MNRFGLIPIFTALMMAGAPASALSQSPEQDAAARQHHGHGADAGHAGHAGHGAAGTVSDNAVIRAYQQANEKMHGAMTVDLTGDADVDFMRGMIPHHQGAIDMAHIVLEHGSDPEVRQLARDVIAAQQKEIEMMRKWLKEKGQ